MSLFETGKAVQAWSSQAQVYKQTGVADFSHWINVAETDTNDPALNAVIADVAAPRAAHVHCRVARQASAAQSTFCA